MCDIGPKETGIPCIDCGRKSGLDCPGRKPDEATRCSECTDIFVEKMRVKQVEHLAGYIRDLRRKGDTETERVVWSAVADEADREDIRRLLDREETHEASEGQHDISGQG